MARAMIAVMTNATMTCPSCDGDGVTLVAIPVRHTHDLYCNDWDDHELTCEACGGSGQVPLDYVPCCHCCGGAGVVYWGRDGEPCPDCNREEA